MSFWFKEVWRTGKDELRSSTLPFEVFVPYRNENWVDQIEGLLAAEGVEFVAASAGHLVGAKAFRKILPAAEFKPSPAKRAPELF